MRKSLLFPLIFTLGAAAAGCPTLPEAIPCGQIPAGGCPVGRGGTCDDPTCRGLYDCIDGKWVSDAVCPTPDGGTGGGLPDAGTCTKVTLDLTGELTNCTPDLQAPDCAAEAALPCVESACLTGCSDFFLCTKNGWVDVAYCSDDGTFTVTQ